MGKIIYTSQSCGANSLWMLVLVCQTTLSAVGDLLVRSKELSHFCRCACVCLCLGKAILVRALCLSGLVFLPIVVILSTCQVLHSSPHHPWPSFLLRCLRPCDRLRRWGWSYPARRQVLGPLSASQRGICWAPPRHQTLSQPLTCLIPVSPPYGPARWASLSSLTEV